MTIDQMAQSLKSVGACFAVSSAKTILPNDRSESKPSYHIHPNSSYPHQDSIERVFSQKQLMDWVRTKKAAMRCEDQADAYDIWQAYEARWDDAGL